MVAINKLVDFAKKIKKDCVIFKVDLKKAYDYVSRSFLDYMLGRFDFCVKWCFGPVISTPNGSRRPY